MSTRLMVRVRGESREGIRGAPWGPLSTLSISRWQMTAAVVNFRVGGLFLHWDRPSPVGRDGTLVAVWWAPLCQRLSM
jgi:hypothetical protein